ncbi:hypothetical protein AB0F81_39300 [Actinoplanes sp. NPDC024001]|uniref:DUF6903 family protein n=1 Tax=Actinoplanes sp. NPDC024001 TaxID=3154598 RepID=UPI003400E352
MKESRHGVAIVVARIVIAISCVVTVLLARPSVGWGNLAVMLVALVVLLGLLAEYNRKYR